MIVRLNLSPLRETRWYEHAIRFVLGGAMTVIAGLIAARDITCRPLPTLPFSRVKAADESSKGRCHAAAIGSAE
jgi:hypothetical protein